MLAYLERSVRSNFFLNLSTRPGYALFTLLEIPDAVRFDEHMSTLTRPDAAGSVRAPSPRVCMVNSVQTGVANIYLGGLVNTT